MLSRTVRFSLSLYFFFLFFRHYFPNPIHFVSRVAFANIGTSAYLVELWPYAQRSRGIGVQQIFGKLAGFFSTNVNSIALSAIAWRYLAIYCGWIFFELCIVFFLYPETSGRTLEELAFRKFHVLSRFRCRSRFCAHLLTPPPFSLRGQGVQRQAGRSGREAHPIRFAQRYCRWTAVEGKGKGVGLGIGVVLFIITLQMPMQSRG